VDKSTLKYILPLLALILFLSLLVFEKKKENEVIYQRILAEQQAQKEARKNEEKNYLMGKFDPAQREDFILVPGQYITIGGSKMYLRKETLDAFLKMQAAADKDEMDLKIASATRNFDYQKSIWNDKWTGAMLVGGENLSITIPDELERFKKILEYSAVPGTSRHHWGTDIDINDSTPPYFDSEKGEKEYAWLVKNARLFGFCQPYNFKNSTRPEGYNEEKWHWSYLPLSKNFTQEYKNLIKDEDIKDFLGDEYVSGQDLINRHVLAINPDCL